MALILFVLMVTVVLTVEWLMRRREAQSSDVRKPVPMTTEQVDGVSLVRQLSYHPFHTWAHRQDVQTARVGIDDFGRRLLGPVAKVILPMEGMNLEAGQTCVRISDGERSVSIVSPVGGEVLEVNPQLKENPGLIFDDPYGEGWLFTVRNWRLLDQLKSLLSGASAATWMHGVIDRLRASMPAEAGAVAQDGGLLCDDLSAHLDRYEWMRMVREHLGTEPTETKH